MGGVGYDSNVYVIDKELIVDTGTGIFFPQIKEEIINLGIDPKKVKWIVNTHAHFDNTGGNKKFRDFFKAKIAIHRSDRKALENGEILAEMFSHVPRSVTVDRSLRDGDKIKTKNFTFEVISTPGHTPGSICLYERDKKILISGDTLFPDGVGRYDLPGGDKKALVESLKRLSELKINYLLPGHGIPKVGGVEFLIRQMLSRKKLITKDLI